jgi:hypothetical protein
LLFGLSNIVHIVLLLPLFMIHQVLTYVMQVDVR